MFRKGKFELLALNETNLKENGVVSWHGVNGITVNVQNIKMARGGVDVLMNDEWHSAVIDFGFSSFQGLKNVWWWCIAPLKGKLMKGRDLETRLYHVPLSLQCVYGCSDEK